MQTIYELFKSMYGSDLGLHLEGWTGVDYTGNSLYTSTGWIVVFASLFWVVTFYYFINNPRFARWYHWLLILCVNFIILLAVSFYLVQSDYNNGDIAADIEPLISTQNMLFWGVTNGIIASLLFIIFSFTLRWWSTNCSTTPIPQ